MDAKEREQRIIDSYRQDEHMMILVFAQWCVNHDLNPAEVYVQAYPDQGDNPVLKQMSELTVPKEEAGEIADDTLLGVLSMFGNEDLAFVVTEEIAKQQQRRK
ncbi:hypothetical protein AWM70_20530 [Paenibacillus yonginensis]|uniref:YxiS n=1 Tax=Paenibacillus yonginensis TaxID=1462996 RepID=A0A1B1N7E7_9BACL|nr:hypothetical protein [Paenibacillus yonginensis]ANS77360.1 hypothetical protein AWM70_20530 [Paenibacillus yonginensis]